MPLSCFSLNFVDMAELMNCICVFLYQTIIQYLICFFPGKSFVIVVDNEKKAHFFLSGEKRKLMLCLCSNQTILTQLNWLEIGQISRSVNIFVVGRRGCETWRYHKQLQAKSENLKHTILNMSVWNKTTNYFLNDWR